MIDCTDGMTRTEADYIDWIHNLVKLAECEPEDLTKSERQALIEVGYVELFD